MVSAKPNRADDKKYLILLTLHISNFTFYIDILRFCFYFQQIQPFSLAQLGFCA